MQAFICLGVQRDLAREEFAALCPDWSVLSEGTDTILVEGESLNLQGLQGKAGGVIKTGSLYTFIEKDEDLPEALAGLAAVLRPEAEKVIFGISVHSAGGTMRMQELRKQLTRLGMTVKKQVEGMGKSARFVSSMTPVLSSVIIVKQQLLTKGIEFSLCATKDGWWIGVTETVQDFEGWAHRDMGRPGRDAKRGMLPPKLARLMLNLAGNVDGKTVLDPYCGSGTVLTEAMELSAGNIIGSDIDSAAVALSRTNILWANQEKMPANMQLFISPVEQVSDYVPAESIDVMVAEGFLGKPKQGSESPEELQEELDRLSRHYAEALPNLYAVLKPGGVCILALPAFCTEDGEVFELPIRFAAESAGFTQERFHHARQVTNQGALRYARQGQMVWRDIYRWKK